MTAFARMWDLDGGTIGDGITSAISPCA